MSNPLVEHADRELKLMGYSPDAEDPMSRVIYASTLDMMYAFTQVGHSGGSAEIHTWMVADLLRFKSLSPLTDDPEEWEDISDFMGPGPTGVWQSKRNGSMMSEDGGKTYYCVDEFRRGWKRKLLGRKGKIYKSMPKR